MRYHTLWLPGGDFTADSFKLCFFCRSTYKCIMILYLQIGKRKAPLIKGSKYLYI